MIVDESQEVKWKMKMWGKILGYDMNKKQKQNHIQQIK